MSNEGFQEENLHSDSSKLLSSSAVAPVDKAAATTTYGTPSGAVDGFTRLDTPAGAAFRRSRGSALSNWWAGLSMTTKAVGGGLTTAAIVAGITIGLVAKGGPAIPIAPDNGCTYTDYFLRPYAFPTAYSINWSPSYVTGDLTLNGSSTVDFTLAADNLQCVQLHSKDLDFSRMTLQVQGEAEENIGWYDSQPENERIIIKLPSVYPKGEGKGRGGEGKREGGSESAAVGGGTAHEREDDQSREASLHSTHILSPLLLSCSLLRSTMPPPLPFCRHQHPLLLCLHRPPQRGHGGGIPLHLPGRQQEPGQHRHQPV